MKDPNIIYPNLLTIQIDCNTGDIDVCNYLDVAQLKSDNKLGVSICALNKVVSKIENIQRMMIEA